MTSLVTARRGGIDTLPGRARTDPERHATVRLGRAGRVHWLCPWAAGLRAVAQAGEPDSGDRSAKW